MLLKLVYLTLLLGSGGYALWRGGTPERLGALVWAANNFLTPVVQLTRSTRIGRFDPGIAIVDVATLAVLVWLALRTNRYWPVWVAAIHLIGVLGHVSRWLIRGEMNTWAYQVLISDGGYLIWPIIAIGAWRHHRRTRTYGADSSWAHSSTA